MVFYERVSMLAKERSKSLNQIEKDLKYPKNTLYNYKKKQPAATRLQELADYFKVSTDYLLGNTNTRSQPLRTIMFGTMETKGFDVFVTFENMYQAESVFFYSALSKENQEIIDKKIFELISQQRGKKFTDAHMYDEENKGYPINFFLDYDADDDY